MFSHLPKHVIHLYFIIKILIYQARFHHSTTVVPETWYFGYQTQITQCTSRISGTTYVVPVWYPRRKHKSVCPSRYHSTQSSFRKTHKKILKQHFYKNVILKIAILHLKSIIFEHIFDNKAYYIQKYTKIP